MSDMNLGVGLEFSNAMKGLKKFMTSTKKFNDTQEKAYKRQISLQTQLNKLRSFQPPPIKQRTVRQPSTPIIPKPDKTPQVMGPFITSRDKAFLKKRAKERSKVIDAARKEDSRRDILAAKEVARKSKLDSKSTSSVNPMVGPQISKGHQSSVMAAAKAQTRETNKLAAAEERRIKALNKAKRIVEHSAFMMKKDVDAAEKLTQESIRNKLATKKTAQEVREMYRHHTRVTKEIRKQSFLMKRMKNSSEHFAGNMFSAFAAAGVATAVTQTGQDFEAVSNTMLAVSKDSQEAGENLAFVKDEAFRLGLGLKESAKGFAKMNAARGELSLEDTKKAFTGISEMSTLLGLSAEESGRAINALQQMLSKGVVSAEELSY